MNICASTPPQLDADAYRRGWNDSANGAPARVPDEYVTATEIDGYVWGWIDFVLGVDKRNDDQPLPIATD